MLTFIKIVFLIIGIVAIVAVFIDGAHNFKKIKKCNTKNFSGEAVSVSAEVTAIDKYVGQTSRSQLWYAVLKYEVNGFEYSKEVELLDIGKAIKEGDKVTVLYDSLYPENAFMEDEIQSAKNGLKMDVGYLVIIAIVALIIFFLVLN